MPKPFRRAKDGASKSPVMAEKHRLKIRALRALLAANLNARPGCSAGPGVDQKDSRSDAAPGAPFLWLLSLGVKESGKRLKLPAPDSAE